MSVKKHVPLISEDELLGNLGRYRDTEASCPTCDAPLPELSREILTKRRREYEGKIYKYLNEVADWVPMFTTPVGFAIPEWSRSAWQIRWINRNDRVILG